LILIEGPQLVAEAVTAGLVVEVGFATDGARFPDAVEVSVDVLGRLSTTATPNAVLAVVRRPAHALRPGADLAVLWDVSEPGNVGALIRSAAAFGLDVLVGGPLAADPWSPKALRAGAGGHFHTRVQVAAELSLQHLHDGGFASVATVPRGGDSPACGGEPAALLIGSEAHGLPAEVVDAASRRWTIPTLGVESLNAAVAGSLAMYELSGLRSSAKADG
jgi:TrmH family RNA methyltransferase